MGMSVANLDVGDVGCHNNEKMGTMSGLWLKDHWSKCLVSISVDKSTNLKKIAVTIGFPLPEFPKLEIPGNPNVRQYRQKLEFSGPKKLLPNVRGPNTAEILEGMHIAALRLAFLRYTFQFVRLHFCRNPAWFFPSPLESRNVFPSSWNTQTRLPFPRKWRTSLRVSWRWKNENPTDSTEPVGFPSSPSPRSCLIYSRQDAITVFDKLRCFWGNDV